MIGREIRLVRRPAGRIAATDFALHESEIGAPAAGEVLAEVRWLSIDPYLAERAMGDHAGPMVPIGARMPGRGIGVVLDGALPAGTVVFGELGWRSHALVPVQALNVLPESTLPPTWHLSVLGVPGMTAWLALFDVAALRPGETVLVTSAAGTVGAIAVQLARAAGARVVGVAGGAAKCEWLRDLGATAVDRGPGFDQALAGALAHSGGFDVLLDHVGGALLEAALAHARLRARVVLSGHVGVYGGVPARLDADLLLYRRLRVEGFLVHEHGSRFEAARAALLAHALAGRIRMRETVHEGLATAPTALVALLQGSGVGKHLVRVS